ncbi:MAG TPA: hypothetical protein VIN07_05940 [Flavipsychrobacter sp.]
MKELICLLGVLAMLNSCAESAGTATSAGQQAAGKADNRVREDCNNATVTAKVQKAYLLQTIVDYTPEEAENWLREYEADTLPIQGLTRFDIDTTYYAHCILGIRYTYGWMGAYPSAYIGYLNYNMRTGDTLRMQDVVQMGSMDELLKLCNDKLNRNIINNRKELVAGDGLEDADRHLSNYPAVFTTENINNYYLSDSGITFFYVFEFPHVMQAMEPDGEVFLNRAELGPILQRGGALAFLAE